MQSVEYYQSKAKELFHSGYNCTQAVVGAFADELNIDTNTLLMIASSFGGGMGRLREVCGTVSGMLIVAGMYFGYSDPKNVTAKTELYAKVQELAGSFREQHGTIICRELLGVGGAQSPMPEKRTDEYYKKRPCEELCGDAAAIIAKFIIENSK